MRTGRAPGCADLPPGAGPGAPVREGMELPPAGGTFRAGAASHEGYRGSVAQQAPRSFQTPHSPVVPGVSFWVHHWALYLRPLWETSLPAL